MTRVLLVMRKGYGIHADHIETMRRLGLEISLLTEVERALDDARFTEVVLTPRGSKTEALKAALAHSAARGIQVAMTFQETDIELCSAINDALGARMTSVSAAETSRDKSRQRDFLLRHGLPTPAFSAVSNVEEGERAATKIGYPVILKPTRAASSVQVALVQSAEELRERLEKIEALARSQSGNYYEAGSSGGAPFALVEEFLPGEEVTLDAVVMGGDFHLGGIHNKMRMPGPFFEEDLYTLPFARPAEEATLVAIASGICKQLGLTNALFNVELRQDKDGDYKVVEFSPRISGGHVYRNVRDVYGIDLVAAHVTSAVAELAPLRAHFSRRVPPRMSTCIKFVYRTGTVVENHAGPVSTSPAFAAYYPAASPGSVIKSAPAGFDIAGLLSIRHLYRDPADLEAAKALAARLEGSLGLVVSPHEDPEGP